MVNEKILENTSKGVVNLKDLKKTAGYPSDQALEKGPVVVIECVEEIPCNPCEAVCKKNVIVVEEPISNLPRLVNLDACTVCGQCVIECPGLAIFIVHKHYSKDKALITIPYELKPLPEIGEKVVGLDRSGNEVCEAEIIKVQNNKSFNKTNLIKFSVPKEYVEEVRFFKRKK